MTENSIVFIGGGKISRWVADQIDLDVLGFYDIDETRSTFDSLNEAIDANAHICYSYTFKRSYTYIL